jgi:predicted nucleic acid-binding protein
MRALLDTNLILDLFLERPEFIRAAEELWEANRRGRFNGFVSALTPATVFYIGRKVKGEAARRQALAGLLAKFEVCAVDHATLQFALGLPLKDYEDAIQLASAMSYRLDAIITRDLEDFAGAGIPIFSPADFLKQLTPAQG